MYFKTGEGLVSPIQASTTFPSFSHKVTVAAADEPEALELRDKFASHLDKSQNVTRYLCMGFYS